jgi:gas vesicle protein
MNKVVWFLIGIGAGACAGLLYAPQEGTRTRRMLASKSTKGRRFLKKHGSDLKDNVAETFGRSRVAVTKSFQGFLG